jgi:hypothetical protein
MQTLTVIPWLLMVSFVLLVLVVSAIRTHDKAYYDQKIRNLHVSFSCLVESLPLEQRARVLDNIHEQLRREGWEV